MEFEKANGKCKMDTKIMFLERWEQSKRVMLWKPEDKIVQEGRNFFIKVHILLGKSMFYLGNGQGVSQ